MQLQNDQLLSKLLCSDLLDSVCSWLSLSLFLDLLALCFSVWVTAPAKSYTKGSMISYDLHLS